ncbi:MAG TPA: hypothetical protein PLD47_00870 [Aggregatilineales bacterium]|nr:hypothetical protein [Anaerolineales bacterium]HRE46250.1 hypothetical protein [Aggregatilineales bacterium]
MSHTPPITREGFTFRQILVILILIATLFAVLLLAIRRGYLPAPNMNRLNLGTGAPQGPLNIPLQAPQDFDGKSKQAIWQIRRAAVESRPDLLAAPYTPSDAVFGQVEDGLPWWGMSGQFYYGAGMRSIEGPSEEARFLLNPYLLVAADFWGLTQQSNPGWNLAMIKDSYVDRPNFPLICQPQGLRWYPSERRAEVTYDVSGCMTALSYWATAPLTLQNMPFDLIAYNARDLNLNYLFLALNESPNLSHYEPIGTPFYITHFLHRGGSCGYPGGCNNMSPSTPEISYYTILALPAQAVIYLWQENPGSVFQTADMRFLIHFR